MINGPCRIECMTPSVMAVSVSEYVYYTQLLQLSSFILCSIIQIIISRKHNNISESEEGEDAMLATHVSPLFDIYCDPFFGISGQGFN